MFLVQVLLTNNNRSAETFKSQKVQTFQLTELMKAAKREGAAGSGRQAEEQWTWAGVSVSG